MLNEREGDLPEHPLQHEVNIQTPGAILMAAREAQGIELSEIAAKLKLSRQWLERIEADIFDRDAFVYLRGYIRAYAQLLNLKVDAVLAALDHAYQPLLEKENERTVLAPQPVVAQVQSHRNTRRMIRMGGMAVALIVFLSLMLWWFDQRPAAIASSASVNLPVSNAQDIPMPAATAAAPAPAVAATNSAEANTANAATKPVALSDSAAPVAAAPLQTAAPAAASAAVVPAAKVAPVKKAAAEPALPAPSSDFTITKVTN